MQSRIMSGVEAVVNTAVGYFVSLISQIIIFPLFGIDVPIRTNVLIGLWFTGVSLARSYLLRRIFNRRVRK